MFAPFIDYRIILSLLFTLIPITVCQTIPNSLYIIRNAESSSAQSLSDVGISRVSQCLPEIFGNYDIGLIMTCSPDPDTGACQTSFATAQPIAVSLGLTVDTSCTVGESPSQHCIKTSISNFAAGSNSSILLVWDENHLSDLRTEFGLRGLSQDQVDAIYTLRNFIYVSETRQNCGGTNDLNSNPVPTPHTSDDTFPAPSSLSPTSVVSVPSQPRRTESILDLYYTTTFTIPDPIATSSAHFIRKRQLHSRRSCRIRSPGALR